MSFLHKTDQMLAQLLAPLAASGDRVLRVAVSLIFVVGGLGHFFQTEHMLGRLEQSPWLAQVATIADPTLLLHASGLVLFAGGVLLLLGWQVRLACLALFLTLVPITLAIHLAPGHVGPLLKNVAILGALAHFMVHGNTRPVAVLPVAQARGHAVPS